MPLQSAKWQSNKNWECLFVVADESVKFHRKINKSRNWDQLRRTINRERSGKSPVPRMGLEYEMEFLRVFQMWKSFWLQFHIISLIGLKFPVRIRQTTCRWLRITRKSIKLFLNLTGVDSFYLEFHRKLYIYTHDKIIKVARPTLL